jgi:cell division protein FtsI (penicillin-binding protein 3)
MHDHLVKWRMWLVGAVLLAAMCGLAARLGDLHLGNHSRVSRDWETDLLPRRGTIFDRNGAPLAVSLPCHQPFLDPLALKPRHDRVQVAARLAEALNVDMDRILVGFSATNARHQLLPVYVDDRTWRALATNTAVSGVGWEERIVRTYPQKTHMSGVIGFVSQAGQGGEGGAGIESRYNSYLKGIPGRIEGVVDGMRREMWDRRRQHVPAVDGASVYLTLDNNIQYRVETELQQVAAQFNATAAWALVEKVETGEILAMASWPDFDPNRYGEFGSMDWRNLPLCVNYEPGSTMKSFTIAAALNEGAITRATRLDVGYGSWFYGGRVLRDHCEGVIDTSTALARSSNIFNARVALLLGNRRLEAYLRGFGFGRRLEIDLPGEEPGILYPARAWNVLTPTRIAIGQGISVTAVQLLNAYCGLANGGRLMRPYAVDRVVGSGGQVLLQGRPCLLARPVRPEIAAQVCAMLVGVTEEGGTATRAAVRGYSVAGKTGTSQIPIPGRGYSDTDYWSTFVGLVPAEKPVFGVLVTVERPQPQRMGGFVAAPVFARIAESVARYLEIPATAEAGREVAAAEPPARHAARGRP